jgi:hypothetical protein
VNSDKRRTGRSNRTVNHHPERIFPIRRGTGVSVRRSAGVTANYRVLGCWPIREWPFIQCEDMFSSIRKAKILIPFFYERLGDYAELARIDLVQFRNETIHSIAGAVIGGGALLLLLSFIGIAAIVTEWDTPNRVLTAWLVVLGWSVCAGTCMYLARRLMKYSPPFSHIGSVISSDLTAIKNPGDRHDSGRAAKATGERNNQRATRS